MLSKRQDLRQSAQTVKEEKVNKAPTGLEFISNELLIKVKKEVKSKIKEDPNNTGITSLNEKFKQHKVKGFEKVAKEGKNSKTDADIFQWYKVVFEGVSKKITSMDLLATSLQNLKEDILSDPNIEKAEFNYFAFTDQLTPNDPYYSSSGSWGQSYGDLWGLKTINAVNVWNKSQGQGVVVAVTDTGLDRNHEDIINNVWFNTAEIPNNGVDDDKNGYVDDYYGWDFVSCNQYGSDGNCSSPRPEDNDPMDDNGHGTHVSGTIAAVANNNLGIVGVAPQAKIMALKGFDAYGYGVDSDLSNAILYAADNGARVINASWGSGQYPENQIPQILADAINYAHDIKGVVFVASAGNKSSNAKNYFPASSPNVITVASSDHLDKKSDFSNWGVKIDVIAPGGDSGTYDNNYYNNILSLRANGTDLYGGGAMIVGNNYYRARGTSMAAPHTSGVAALILSLNPSWSPEEIRQALHLGADDILLSGFDLLSGYGRLNADKTLLQSKPLIVHMINIDKTDSNLYKIYGIVSGTGFARWELKYALIDNPYTSPVWVNIVSSNQPISTPALITNWDVSQLTNKNYILLLQATKTSGEVYEDRAGSAQDFCTICKADITGDRYVNGADRSRVTVCYSRTSDQMDDYSHICALSDLDSSGVVDDIDMSCVGSHLTQECVYDCSSCKADLNKDGYVNGADTSLISSCWGKRIWETNANGVSCRDFDIDGGEIIGEGDLNCVKSQFLQTCQQITPTYIPTPTSTLTPRPTATATPTPLPDTVSPSVYITYPLNNSTVTKNKTINISASASDNVAISKVEFYINNTLKCTDTTSPYSCSWSVPNKTKVKYTLSAKAYDAVGNMAAASINVTSK